MQCETILSITSHLYLEGGGTAAAYRNTWVIVKEELAHAK